MKRSSAVWDGARTTERAERRLACGKAPRLRKGASLAGHVGAGHAVSPMTTVRDKVREETQAFEELLSDLTSVYAGKWIVFRDRQVQGSYETEEEAYQAAVAEFGYAGGFIIVQVVPRPPSPLTAAMLFMA